MAGMQLNPVISRGLRADSRADKGLLHLVKLLFTHGSAAAGINLGIRRSLRLAALGIGGQTRVV